MKRMCRSERRWMAVLACVAFPVIVGAQDFDKVQVALVKVADGVYMFTGAGGNIGVSVGDSGVLLVDSQFGELHGKISEAIASVHKGPVCARASVCPGGVSSRALR